VGNIQEKILTYVFETHDIIEILLSLLTTIYLFITMYVNIIIIITVN